MTVADPFVGMDRRRQQWECRWGKLLLQTFPFLIIITLTDLRRKWCLQLDWSQHTSFPRTSMLKGSSVLDSFFFFCCYLRLPHGWYTMLLLSSVFLIWKQYCQQIYYFPATQYLDNFINKTFHHLKSNGWLLLPALKQDSQRLRDTSYRQEPCMYLEIQKTQKILQNWQGSLSL